VPARHASAERPSTVRHAREHRSGRVLRGTALVTVALLAFGGTAVYATYQRLNNNIHKVDVSALLGERPTRAAVKPGEDPNAGRDVNILLLGSDSREGENGDIGGRVAGGMRSDTSIVMHVSADRERVEMVSIPRDSMVAIPTCRTTAGDETGASDYAMFNEAFARGWDTGLDLESAAACTWRTVEANTGIVIDDFVLVDFAGFEDMVDALDEKGVWICIPQDMDDEKAKLHVTQGYQQIDGRTALAYARSRHSQASDGSDIGRIGNQQRLLAAIADQILSANVLTDWTELLGVLSAATRSLTTSMGTPDIAGLAYSARAIRTGNITFMTIPWGAAPDDPNRVVWTPEADVIWDNIAHDEPMLTGTAQDPGTTETTSPTPKSTPKADATHKANATPKPKATKKAGRDAFTLDDNTGSC
jgi:LCP family protein required for cell wall assembly